MDVVKVERGVADEREVRPDVVLERGGGRLAEIGAG